MSVCVFYRGNSVTHSWEDILCIQTAFHFLHGLVSVVQSWNGNVGPCWRHALRHVFKHNHHQCKVQQRSQKPSDISVNSTNTRKSPILSTENMWRWTDLLVSALSGNGISHPLSQAPQMPAFRSSPPPDSSEKVVKLPLVMSNFLRISTYFPPWLSA